MIHLWSAQRNRLYRLHNNGQCFTALWRRLMLRIGFLGGGGIALAHAIALSRIPGVRITAAADPIEERARAITKEFGGRAFTDFNSMWDLVDAVWVCTPPFMHKNH